MQKRMTERRERIRIREKKKTGINGEKKKKRKKGLVTKRKKRSGGKKERVYEGRQY